MEQIIFDIPDTYYVIVGSAAMKYHFPNAREPKDIDIIMYEKDLDAFMRMDASMELVKRNENAAIIKVLDYNKEKQCMTKIVYEVLFADKVELYQKILKDKIFRVCDNDTGEWYVQSMMLYYIKKAHIHFPQLSHKFEKHIQDLVFLRKMHSRGAYTDYEFCLNYHIDIFNNPFYVDMHRKTTEERLGVIKTPKLFNKPVDEFFDQSKEHVKSYYIHDNMHKAMAHNPGNPAYEQMQKDKSKADCSKDLWEKMGLQSKQHCVLEEAYVIALERKILPQMFEDIETKYDELAAFKWALMRICTNLCSGWFRWFACVNYEEVMKQYNPDYVKIFFKKIKQYENDNN